MMFQRILQDKMNSHPDKENFDGGRNRIASKKRRIKHSENMTLEFNNKVSKVTKNLDDLPLLTCKECDKPFQHPKMQEKCHKETSCNRICGAFSGSIRCLRIDKNLYLIQPSVCDECRMRSNTTKSNKALTDPHESPDFYKCIACGDSYWDKSNLINHIRRVHRRELESALMDHDYLPSCTQIKIVPSNSRFGIKLGCNESTVVP